MSNHIFELKGGWKYTVKMSERLLSSHFYTAVETGREPTKGTEI